LGQSNNIVPKPGKLEEDGTWEDFFKLDHLEAEKDTLKKALEVI
jgi:hypothetical protein